LAAPRGPEEADELALVDGQRHVAQRLEAAEALAELDDLEIAPARRGAVARSFHPRPPISVRIGLRAVFVDRLHDRSSCFDKHSRKIQFSWPLPARCPSS